MYRRQKSRDNSDNTQLQCPTPFTCDCQMMFVSFYTNGCH